MNDLTTFCSHCAVYLMDKKMSFQEKLNQGQTGGGGGGTILMAELCT